MKEFYLTEVVNLKRAHSHENKTKIKKYNPSQKTNRRRSSSLGMHAYLSRNSKFFNDTKLQFLDFLIEEQTKFADLEKIETYYRSLTVKTHKEYNNKKLLIEKKKEELKALDISIESHLINSIKFKKEEIENFFEKIKIELNSQISDTSYDIECYKNVKERLYKSHIILQKSLQDQLESESICENQVHKYKIIKNDSIYTMQRQKKFLNNMKVFHDLRNMTFQSEIGKRKSKFNKIEYTLLNIRNDAEEIQQSLKDFKEKISDRQNSLAIAVKKNQSISNDYKIFLREFLKIQIRLLYLKKNLQVKSVDEIILRINQERLNYQNYYSRIVEMNKKIAILNIKHTQIKNKLEFMISKISKKNDEKNLSQLTFDCYSEKDFINEFQLNDENPFPTHTTLIEIQEANFNLKEKIKKIEIFLLSMCKFLEFYEKKVSEEIKHFRIVLMLETETNQSVENFSLTKSKNNQFARLKSFAVNESKIKNFFLSEDALSFDPMAIKKFFKFFFDFESKFLYLVNIVSANVGLDMYSSKMDKNSLDAPEKSSSNCEDRQKIIFIFNENILNSLEGMKSLAITKLENKYKILNRSENNIFKQLKLEKKAKLLSERRRTTMNNIYSNFLNHVNKDEKSSDKSAPVEFIQSIESKLSSQMAKYTNDYVKGSMDIVLEKKNENRKSFFINSQKNKNEISTKSLKIDLKIINKDSFQSFQTGLTSNSMKVDPSKDKEITNSTNLEDSYLTDIPRDDKDRKKTNPTKFRLKNRSEDFTKINDRKQDLQKLENKNYFDKNHNDKNIMKKSDFMEIFYNYKKKHIKNLKNDLVSSTSHFTYKVVNKSKSKTQVNFRKSPLKISDSTGDLRNKIDISEQPLGIIRDNDQVINTKREKSEMKNASSFAFHSTRISHTHNNRTSIDFKKSEREITNLKISFMNKNHNKLPSIRFEPYTN